MDEFPEEKIVEATRLLRGVAHELRLSILCHLEEGPLTVSELMARTGASQSNLSQHLAKMRMMGLLSCERRSQQVLYQLADPTFAQLIEVLKSIYCPTPQSSGKREK
ncbi:MAG: metalloregulator ArsR/SmtB family transcription factor [Gammaproteobacteria bacterium]|jgi:DNA-binding transcriptional ArsR family regulator